MKQNIYDNETFYHSYMNLRETMTGLNDVLEIPAFRALLSEMTGKAILDLGCGYGEACKWYVGQGAGSVVGIDISRRMIEKAKATYSDEKIDYQCCPIEDVEFSDNRFDMVLSSLAFHYVADYGALVNKIGRWLKPGGYLLFSQEHPIATAKKVPDGWVKGDDGRKIHWITDNYSEEGLREQTWFINGVIKYHRTMATLVNTLIDEGFRIAKVVEPTALPAAEKMNCELKNERRRPPFVIIKAQKD
ncbi:MAG: class I SAM-dependent methyltransferase [Veillonellales bacterium]